MSNPVRLVFGHHPAFNHADFNRILQCAGSGHAAMCIRDAFGRIPVLRVAWKNQIPHGMHIVQRHGLSTSAESDDVH